MAQDRERKGYEGSDIGTVKIADDVVVMIAAYAAMEVEGVVSLDGGVTTEVLSKSGIRKVGRSVKVEVSESGVKAALSIVLAYGYNIPSTSSAVQKRVKTAIENMTGLQVKDVDISIVGIAEE